MTMKDVISTPSDEEKKKDEVSAEGGNEPSTKGSN
jgi:hypothetical protein